MYQRILVPLDGSKLAERVLATAEEFARLMQASLLLVRVVDPTQTAMDGDDLNGLALGRDAPTLLRTDAETAAQAYLERMVKRASEQGLSARSELRYGIAAREIVATTQPGDLIVMSTHGRGGMARWFMGSVAEEVARRSTVPVLLVRGTRD
jgi:nucleotide-binding universal stress UspA family protein